MNTDSLIDAINKDSALLKVDSKDLEQLIESFPYFQSARKLYLKKLKLEKNYKFNSELKKTAAFVSDRNLLFDFITQEDVQEEGVIEEKIEQLKSVEEEEISRPKKELPKKEQKQSVVHKTLEFNKSDVHSFNEWLQLSNLKVIHRKEDGKQENITQENKESTTKKNKFELIEKFISTNPKLKPKPRNEGTTTNIALSSTKEKEGWMTETLAHVYVEQKKYSKAIKAYKILGLKYPEKSGFFADQIRAIKKLEGS